MGWGNHIQAGNYVGIMGAVAVVNNQWIDPTGQNRYCDMSSGTPEWLIFHGGVVASNGVFYPLSQIRHRNLLDGSSNTLMIGEQSDWGHLPPGIDPNGGSGPFDIRATARMGI